MIVIKIMTAKLSTLAATSVQPARDLAIPPPSPS